MADASDALKTTPLHAVHEDLDARMMGFGGFDMPVQYSSIIEEHMAVREKAGLFDVSHMGELLVSGPQALPLIQRLVTNDASNLYDGRAMYTVMCTPEGGIIDDLIVYRRAEERYMLVLNAANVERDLEWIHEHNTDGASLNDISDETALLALQGPRSLEIAQPFLDRDLDDLKFYHFWDESGVLGCDNIIISRTGYTGEVGLELYVPADEAPRVWNTLLDAGEDAGLKPAGLGARDTLRLEAGLCLHGNDITEQTNPYEAGLGWLVKLEKGDFIGREALQSIHDEGPSRQLVGFVATERGIPRHDHVIQSADGETIGAVTSGTQSPVLEAGIGLGYVPNTPAYTEPGQSLQIASRRRTFTATVKEPPLHKDD
ncbi:glycine cleavage system protein T [Salinibacter sp. 10B]|uniref:glycine cleavage system aminomethyltransferase GcvT n=1 Tax=Salinibacter sp. 10B TaxID=1923971 RepID=UPI000CF4D95B|nr:glycine cleavage system aminomethyltransferase GcvT [Salinibacter sp. 10B]PQJ35799.1 glycine cleavage system protein T [Salinibacter sp. 10B]